MSRDTPARISQCSLNAWLNGLASGDYRRVTGSDGAVLLCVCSFIHWFVYLSPETRTCRALA